MELSIAYLLNNKQLALQTIEENGPSHQDILDLDFSSLKERRISCLLYNQDDLNDEIANELNEFHQYIPIRSFQEMNLDASALQGLNFSEMRSLSHKMNRSWTLRSNLELVEEFAPTLESFTKMYTSDRNAFFESLWFLFKRNLSAVDLKIFFHDIEKIQTKNDKKKSENLPEEINESQIDQKKFKLINYKVQGPLSPVSLPLEEGENFIFNKYKAYAHDPFSVLEYDSEKGEVLFTASIRKGPIVIMAKILELSPLQISIFKGFMKGLSQVKFS